MAAEEREVKAAPTKHKIRHAVRGISQLKRWKRVLTVVTLVLPFLYTGFIIADRYGVWDAVSGLDLVEQVSATFELSYAPNASNPVRVGDKAWDPLLNLVYRYSSASFDRTRQPKVIARLQASLSTRTPEKGPLIAEWTAPSTPLFIIYVEWPSDKGGNLRNEDWRVIGTIGDLKEWISKEKDRRRFLVQDIFLGTFGPLLAVVIFWLEVKADSGA